MPHPPCNRPIPRAQLDPITTFSEALWLMMSTVDTDLVEETVLFVLDDTRCGVAVLHTDGADANDIIESVDWVTAAAADTVEAAGLIVGTVRPGGGAELGDHMLWAQISELCDDAGIELIEWIVLGSDGVTCPRHVAGEPARWEP